MATQSAPQKILRVGIIQNGRIIEERLLRSREAVTVGQKLKNTFVIASSVFPGTLALFEVSGNGYVLNLAGKMSGRISMGDGVFDVEALKSSGRAKKTSGGYRVELSSRSRGKVVLGDVTILFQFVTPPPLRVLPQLPANMRGGLLHFVDSVLELRGGLLLAMLFSLLLQGGGIAYLVFMVPPPPRSEALSVMPDRFIQILAEQAELPPEEPADVEFDPNGEGEVVADTNAEEPVEDDSSNNEDSDSTPSEEPASPSEENRERYAEARSQDEIRDIAQTRVRQESALAAFYGSSDGGVDLGIGTTDTFGSARAEEALARQQALGEGGGGAGGGVVSSTGLASAGGAEGNVNRQGMDSGPSAIATAGGPEQTEVDEPQRVEVRGSVRVSESRTAGAGRLDNSSLQRVLRRRRRDIERCYTRGLAQDPELEGRVAVQFTINENGRVDDVRLRENELGSSVGNCITGAVRRWRFDQPEGGSVTVRTPYIFSASN